MLLGSSCLSSTWDLVLLFIAVTSLYYFSLSLFFLGHAMGMQNFPNRGSNPCPPQWKLGILTPGPSEKSDYFSLHLFIYLFYTDGPQQVIITPMMV